MTIDDELTAALSPLRGVSNLHVWVPFFANTFPLAFYYARATGRQPSDDTWGTWSRFKDDPRKTPQLFYASEDEVKALERQLPNRVRLEQRLVTRYRPRWFFLDASTEAARYVRDAKGTLTPEALDIFRWHGRVGVVTDIPSTAKVVQDYLTRLVSRLKVEIVGNDWRLLTPDEKPRLKVHFFGAPRTALYRTNDRRYTKVEIPDEAFESGPLDTFVVVAGSLPAGKLKTLISSVEQFHHALFDAARRVALGPEPDRELRSLWRAYAKREETIQAEGSFRDPRQYAACLHDHHLDPSTPSRVLPSASREVEPWHTHIGAGALGLGLVLPCLEQRSRLIVLQRHSDRWDKLRAATTVQLKNNRGWSRTVRPIFADANKTVKAIAARIDSAFKAGQPVLLIAKNPDVTAFVLGHSDAISHSIGDGQWEILRQLREIETPDLKAIYPFENTSRMDALQPRVTVAHVVVDRICEEAEIDEKIVTVKCEPEGSIMYYMKNSDDGRIQAFTKSHINVTRLGSEAEYLFFRRRKRYLMNGVHYVLAALAYDVLRERRIDSKLWDAQLMPILVSLVLSREGKYLPIIGDFIEFQAVRLAVITEASIRRKHCGSDVDTAAWNLQSWAEREVLPRTEEVEDKLGRILPLRNVDNVLRKSREFLIESLRAMIRERDAIAKVKAPRGGGLPEWFVAITSVLEAVLLTQSAFTQTSEEATV